MEPLAPCPHCNFPAEIVSGPDLPEGMCCVECTGCHARGGLNINPVMAVRLWARIARLTPDMIAKIVLDELGGTDPGIIVTVDHPHGMTVYKREEAHNRLRARFETNPR